MNSKGFSFMVSAILVIIMLIAGATFIYQRKQATEKTFLGSIWDMAFPSKTESIEIPGTTVGGGCGTRQITDTSLLAAAVQDCWKKATAGTNNPCCYKIDASKLTTTIGEKDLSTRLSGTGVSLDWRIEANLDKTSSMFTVCYDAGWGGEVFLTRTPAADCS